MSPGDVTAPEPGDLIGQVLRIERSSIHDGPGLRTVVFLQGCPLRCRWCSTPESQLGRSQVGLLANRCQGGGECVSTCPAGAISVASQRVTIDQDRCTGCLDCLAACPNGALVGYGAAMTVQSVLAEVQKDEVFFFHSGGGVTLSGGEPLAQARFTAAVLAGAKAEGIHTALETTLFASPHQLAQVLPQTDLLLADLKHLDPVRHRQLTGVSNEVIVKNLLTIGGSAYSGQIIVRIPVIPGLNDDPANLQASAALCSRVRPGVKLELLAYHRLGRATYSALGRDYSLDQIEPPTPVAMAELAARLAQANPGLAVTVGK